jgi:hypothetical protein
VDCAADGEARGVVLLVHTIPSKYRRFSGFSGSSYHPARWLIPPSFPYASWPPDQSG